MHYTIINTIRKTLILVIAPLVFVTVYIAQ